MDDYIECPCGKTYDEHDLEDEINHFTMQFGGTVNIDCECGNKIYSEITMKPRFETTITSP